MANLDLIEKKDIEYVFDFMKSAVAKIESLTYENHLLKESYMTSKQVMEYTGFGLGWLESRQELIGFMQDGKEKRFKRSDVEAYMRKHRIQRKS